MTRSNSFYYVKKSVSYCVIILLLNKMSNPFEKPVVVIDNGSYNIKAGFACDNHPVSIFRTTVGRPKYLQGSYGKTPYEVYIGDDAVERSDELELSYPVVRGRIRHWDNMERVWHHVFYRELKAAPEDRAVLLSCAPSTTVPDKVRCCEIFFESLNAPALCVQPQSFLALFAAGYTTGISVDLGEELTAVNPIFEGGAITYANMETNVAGIEVKQYIKDSLKKRGYDIDQFGITLSDKILNEIWDYLYVTPNCAVTKEQYNKEQYKKEYTLPSGEVIDVSDEAFMAGEMYFQPEAVLGEQSDKLSIHEALVTSILKVDPGLHSEMLDAVVAHGGRLTMPGFNKRLAREMQQMLHRPVHITEQTENYAVAWMGGAVFAGMVGAPRLCVLKKQFEEHGERIVRNRFA